LVLYFDWNVIIDIVNGLAFPLEFHESLLKVALKNKFHVAYTKRNL